jgi:hypothetical protein
MQRLPPLSVGYRIFVIVLLLPLPLLSLLVVVGGIVFFLPQTRVSCHAARAVLTDGRGQGDDATVHLQRRAAPTSPYPSIPTPTQREGLSKLQVGQVTMHALEQ